MNSKKYDNMGNEINKAIYKMKLHETIDIVTGKIEVMRVPGGWNYIYFEINEVGYRNYNKAISYICFVQYNDEFEIVEKTPDVIFT